MQEGENEQYATPEETQTEAFKRVKEAILQILNYNGVEWGDLPPVRQQLLNRICVWFGISVVKALYPNWNWGKTTTDLSRLYNQKIIGKHKG